MSASPHPESTRHYEICIGDNPGSYCGGIRHTDSDVSHPQVSRLAELQMEGYMKIPTEQAREATYGDAPEGFSIVADSLVGKTRWGITHQLVLVDSAGDLWGTTYSTGATEYQEEQPFEYEGDTVEFHAYEKILVPSYQRKQ